jgi:(2Fe-2S) ferredoxin
MNESALQKKKYVLVCTQERPADHPKGSCKQRGSIEVLMKLREEFEQRDLGGIARPVGTTCLGPCETGVTVAVFPDNVWYAGVTAQDVPEIIDSHIINNTPVERLMHKEDPLSLV